MKEGDSVGRRSREVRNPRRYRQSDQEQTPTSRPVSMDLLPSIEQKEIIDKLETNIGTIIDLVMKNHFELIQFKPSEIAFVVIVMARLLTNFKDNSKYNHQMV